MTSKIIWNNMKLVKGKTLVETAMTGVGAYPASGSYIDVSGFEYVHILVHLGTLHTSDTPVLTPKCSDSASGTLDVIDASLAHTPDPDGDDGEWVAWTIAVENLPIDHHFLALAATGTLTNGSYIEVLFLLDGARNLPVTQATAVLPAASRYSWVG